MVFIILTISIMQKVGLMNGVSWIINRFSKPDIKFHENPVTVDNKTNEIIS